ncbi:polysaccharide pyruvyl transferase family protein [Ichthyenterobacterium sp. W332]|uniref:Polysaccharide pyruvyl transferase family protein n=1 Tax=Microcosmobacter mediterraneus TaxID=3075607 RepID=A0ABU2YGS1_9FLAO|nr:polysaccharide pyruvyl transferase family protein [Ichthyenterobacterium sp. W332]MDT0557341.1 polysaccharide pyruvyl transferase family protein [Ichthyenterobacterium sp. W332]
MALRTYYWNTRKVSLLNFYKNKYFYPEKKVFKYGNAGDILNIDLIKYLYQEEPVNIIDKSNRLLLVGSIMSIIQNKDVIAGIGWKGNDLSKKQEVIEKSNVYGVRGPLTRNLFEKYGADLSNLKFEYDPGLLIKEIYNIDENNCKNQNIIFIPHYRDLWIYKTYPKGIKVVNIDNHPKKIIKEILNAKLVYSASLHGIIFSHALNKECIFVKPQSDEPMFKYEDYFLSIGLNFPEPIKSINSINYYLNEGTLLNKKICLDDFCFPEVDFLKRSKIIV